MSATDRLTEMLLRTMESSIEVDRQGNNANVVDGLFAIAGAILFHAKAVSAMAQALPPPERKDQP